MDNEKMTDKDTYELAAGRKLEEIEIRIQSPFKTMAITVTFIVFGVLLGLCLIFGTTILFPVGG